MAATLFDHITQITNVQNPKYWDTLDESDRKTWSNYMVLRFLSMKYNDYDISEVIKRLFDGIDNENVTNIINSR